MTTRAWRWFAPRAALAIVGGVVAFLAPSVADAQEAPPARPSGAAGGCVKDIECKGDRICVEGTCVAPNASPTTPVPASPAPTTPAPPPAPSAPTPTAVTPAPDAPQAPVALPSSPPQPPPPAPAPAQTVPAVPLTNPSAPPTMVMIYTPPVDERLSASGLSFSVRFGVGFPGGDALGSTPPNAFGGASTGHLADAVGVLLPVTVDVGYRLTPHWYVGGYLSVAYGTATGCATGGTGDASCYETDIRFGLDARYNFQPGHALQPWLGVGAGWEILNSIASADEEDSEESGSLNGVEFAHVDLGVDYRINERSKIGPYFLVSFADYDNGYVHEWYTVGARFTYDTNFWRRTDTH